MVNGIKKTALELSRDNLRLLSLAMHNYADGNLSFPVLQIMVKGHPVSWRVTLLPFLRQAEIYNQYRFGEPWDSQHNLRLVPKMPTIYRSPKAPADSQVNNYVGFASAETAFGIRKGIGLDRFNDRLSNTILLVEAETEIPWTKPQDFDLNDEGLNNLKSFYDGVLPVAMADGSTALFSTRNLKSEDLNKFLTRAGDDQVDKDKFLVQDEAGQ